MTLSEPKPAEKSLFRKAQALYHLGRFEEACDTYRILFKHYPGDVLTKKEFNRASARLSEQKSGKYPFKQMQFDAAKRVPPCLDYATYIGPVVVKPVQSKGRGLFASSSVKAGDILLCEKAFEFAYHDENSTRPPTILLHAVAQPMTTGTLPELIKRIVQKLHNNPSLVSKITDLHHGSYNAVNVLTVDGEAVVDSFLVERIAALDSYSCPLSSRDYLLRRELEGKTLEANIASVNISTGIWPLGSYVNHSCFSNAHCSWIGDMMIVRATQDIPAGTEITFGYKPPLTNKAATRGINLGPWGFVCDCVICQDLSSAPAADLAKRQSLLDGAHAEFKLTIPNTTKIASALRAVEQTYRRPAHEIPHLGIWNEYRNLAEAYWCRRDFQEAISAGLKTLESLGWIIRVSPSALTVTKWGLTADVLIGCWMLIARCYSLVQPNRPYGFQAFGYAKLTYRICIGEDVTFEDTYSIASERADGLIEGAVSL